MTILKKYHFSRLKITKKNDVELDEKRNKIIIINKHQITKSKFLKTLGRLLSIKYNFHSIKNEIIFYKIAFDDNAGFLKVEEAITVKKELRERLQFPGKSVSL